MEYDITGNMNNFISELEVLLTKANVSIVRSADDKSICLQMDHKTFFEEVLFEEEITPSSCDITEYICSVEQR
jgi:hypothetical protein